MKISIHKKISKYNQYNRNYEEFLKADRTKSQTSKEETGEYQSKGNRCKQWVETVVT